MGADKQALDAIFKDVLEEGISEGINNANPLRDVIKTEKSDFKGREIVRLAHTSRNQSPFFSGEDSAMADAERQGYARMFVDQKKLTAKIRMTYEVMKDSTSNEGAFISARKSEMQYLIDDIARRDEHALATDGRGILALLDETPGGPVVDLDAPGGITGDAFGNRFVSPGMYVAAINPVTGAPRTSIRRVVACSEDGSTVTLDSATTTGWANNDFLVQAANANVTDVLDTAYEKAWWGIQALVDDGTYRQFYFGLDRAQFPAYASYVQASTGALSTDLMQRVSDVLDQKLNAKVSLILCHHSVRRLVIQLTDADRRYTQGNLMKPDSGTVAFKQGDIPFGDVAVRAIRDIALDSMFFLDTAKVGFKEYVSEPGKWIDEDGLVLRMVGGGTGSGARDAFEAIYRCRKQYFAEEPGYAARLDGITGATLVVVRPAGQD